MEVLSKALRRNFRVGEKAKEFSSLYLRRRRTLNFLLRKGIQRVRGVINMEIYLDRTTCLTLFSPEESSSSFPSKNKSGFPLSSVIWSRNDSFEERERKKIPNFIFCQGNESPRNSNGDDCWEAMVAINHGFRLSSVWVTANRAPRKEESKELSRIIRVNCKESRERILSCDL